MSRGIWLGSIWAASFAVLVYQRDLGASLLLFGVFVAMLYVATGRARDAVIGTVNGNATAPEPARTPTRVEAMRAKLKAGGHTSPYRLRKQLPEPVFGQIKQARGFRQFLMRGLENVRGEWSLICTVHNLLKLAQTRQPS